jgi:heavy metal sensor kinase
VNRLQPQTIRFRLTAWYTAILGVTFAIVAIGVWIALQQSIRTTIDKELRSQLTTVRAYLDREASKGNVAHLIKELHEDPETSAYTNLRIADTAGRWIYQSPETYGWSPAVPDPAGLPRRGRTQAALVRGKALRIISAPVKAGIVQIGMPLDEFEELQEDFLWTAAFGAPVLLFLAALGGFWMSGRALRPVDRIAGAAQRISAQNLTERLPGSGAGDELDRLSGVLNEMLDRLESAFRRITQFTADASHELRTPVAIIRTTAEVTQSRSRTPEEHCQAWDVVQTQAERTSLLIDDLLALARADAGSEELVFEPVNISEIVSSGCSHMQVIAETRGLTIQPRLASEQIVFADPDALRRAVLILLDNATKYTPAPGKIEVLTKVTDQAVVVIEVRDTGIGISSDDLPHIFDRFYRVARDRSRDSGGAGLGLSIAQSIVARHGGRISVESALGSGSVFRIHLPGRVTPPHPFSDSSESANILELKTQQ